MKNIISCKMFLMLLIMVSLVVPNVSSASNQKPTCSLGVTTPAGTIELKKRDTVTVVKGQTVTTAWESKNATKAYNPEGKKIDLQGIATLTPLRSKTYKYKFTADNYSVTCSLHVHTVTGSLVPVVVSVGKTIPKFTGEVTGVRKVQLQIYKVGSTKPAYTSKRTSVKKGDWSIAVSKKLPAGNYLTVLRGDSKYELNTIATSTLTIGDVVVVPTVSSDAPTSVTIFVAQSVPLLVGGVAKGDSSVPVSYIQVINVGKKDGAIDAITIKQNGSAASGAVIGFTVTDDQGMNQVTIGSAASPVVFKNGVALIPLGVSIPVGQMRLYTIRAILRSNVTANVGTQLKFDIISIASSSVFAQTAFPIKGTTWTIAN